MVDGNIVAAKKVLGRAVQRLTAPKRHMTTNRWAPSLYQQLVDDAAGAQGETHTPAKSLPPLWIDNLQLRAEIDRQAAVWCPVQGSTPDRLNRLAWRQWRPQDTELVTGMSARVESWCESIQALLFPEQRVFVHGAACPSCGKRTCYRRDSAGDVVRQPTLKLVADQGCTCQACGAFWGPERYLFLCRLLGFELPEGVLE